MDEALVDAVAADKLRVLKSAAAEDKDAYVVTRKTATDNGLTAIGDLAKIVPFKLGPTPSSASSATASPASRSVYGVGTKPRDVTFVPDRGLRRPGHGEGPGRRLGAGGRHLHDLARPGRPNDLVVLEDPKNMISSQNIVPLVADSVYTDQLGETLNGISAQLTTEDLIALRDRVEGEEKVSADTAAKDWLTQKGLL